MTGSQLPYDVAMGRALLTSPVTRAKAVIACLLGLFMHVDCARGHAAVATSAPSETAVSSREETGKASYYSDALAGRKTANGERYDPSEWTAAHRSLPFGTRVVVTTKSGKTVTVRINDRGPFKKGRIIDLSRRAAESIEMIDAGIVDVSIRVLPP